MSGRNYQDLIAWQKAMDLTVAVYDFTRAFPLDERYGLTSQMRRAAVSVPSNIAEGQGRGQYGDFRRLLGIAHGSIRELETHAILASRLQLAPPEASQKILALASEVGRLVTGLSQSLDREGT